MKEGTLHDISIVFKLSSYHVAFPLQELARKLEELEKKYDAQFKSVFDAIKMLMTPPPDPGPKTIPGFKP